ncbi:MAG TPA: formate dehydrogenase accessory sulfurtransferase FdhD, partial [Streptosporangiaceae bacterium]|nr:formate dehydrogenase accessory sulfurtransferase FdhD [Streptosporangiaceae bacterium]
MREVKGGQLSGRTTRRRVLRVTICPDGPPESSGRADFLAAEEPLGIRVDGTALTMTMRTPGDDIELAAGFLVSEAVVRSPADIAGIRLCDGASCGHGGDHDGLGNIADVSLSPAVVLTPGARRNFMTTSACGVCGKASIEDIRTLPYAALSADQTRFS